MITQLQLKIESVSGNSIEFQSVGADKLNPAAFSGGIEVDGTIKHINEIAAGTSAGITWDAHGHVTGFGPVPSTDLPLATADDPGAVSVPASGGLVVSELGEIGHSNDIVAGAVSGFTYDAQGHITFARPLLGSDLPLATTTEVGGVSVTDFDNNPLFVSDTGVLVHQYSSVEAGTLVSVEVDRYGHVQGGSTVLQELQVPNLPADKITSGTFPTERIADESITAPKMADYSTCLMQEDFPGAADYLGQLWYQPSTAQLRIYSRGSGNQNLWLSVGFGNLQQNNLRWMGTYNAETATLVSLTAIGTGAGLTAGYFSPY